MKPFQKLMLHLTLAMAAIVAFNPQTVQAHCQIPCGIYDDHARVISMLEDAGTVEKSMRLIDELAGKTDAQSQNQMVRWVMNKEAHAQNIIAAIADYFLTQRVKPGQKDYRERLIAHHAVILAAMQAKQKADPMAAATLRKSIEVLAPYYPEHAH